jgi:hypothetical protein
MSFVIWAQRRGVEGNQIRSKRIVVGVRSDVQLSSLCGIEDYIYNNTNYFLLGVIIRRTTSKSAGKGLGYSL